MLLEEKHNVSKLIEYLKFVSKRPQTNYCLESPRFLNAKKYFSMVIEMLYDNVDYVSISKVVYYTQYFCCQKEEFKAELEKLRADQVEDKIKESVSSSNPFEDGGDEKKETVLKSLGDNQEAGQSVDLLGDGPVIMKKKAPAVVVGSDSQGDGTGKQAGEGGEGKSPFDQQGDAKGKGTTTIQGQSNLPELVYLAHYYYKLKFAIDEEYWRLALEFLYRVSGAKSILFFFLICFCCFFANFVL